MKKMIITLCMGLSVPALHAQSEKEDGAATSYILVDGQVAGGVELDTEQRSRLNEVERHYHRSYDQIHNNHLLPADSVRQRLEALGHWREEEIRRVMGPELYGTWKRAKEEGARPAAPR
jgi:hypothetical protein